ncbi:MAG: M3 family metallopeptidase [Phycisphaeraceae bacterium]|nr:M3 family metallopeptidase [Phycisphaeraceae bacterium]
MLNKTIQILLCLTLLLTLTSCQTHTADPLVENQTVPPTDNPLLQNWDTPFGVPPFDQIKTEHYLPAFEEAMARHQAEIQAIANAKKAPTFANTLEAMDASGAWLTQVASVFYNLNSALTNEDMQAIAKEMAPLMSRHGDDIRLNEALFARTKKVYDNRDALSLTEEQAMLLEKTYKDFVRGGALLDAAAKTRFRAINERLSLLSVQFGENVLKDNNRFELVIAEEAQLAGLPERVVMTAAEAAKEKDYQGKWLFTLHKPSLIPFLQYSENREFREAMYRGYTQRGDHNDELDNKAILAEMAALRVERANLLGYPTHAHYVLDNSMAETPDRVYALLDQLWAPALNMAKTEVAAMQALATEQGDTIKLQPWDWWYYIEKVRQQRFDLDENELRPYFKLENVIGGVTMVANKLFGITLKERFDIPTYHKEVKTFEVKRADGSHVGILFTDYFPRASKRGGAWMNSFRKQRRLDGKMVTPLIANTGNFSKPTPGNPSLISLEETLTLFHEFGHGLHGLLSDCTYDRLSGTSVPRDFVELPSQVMENWATEPEVLKLYARHYKTNEPIPDDLIEKIQKSSKFNQGFETVEYLAASYLDMDWHTLKDTDKRDAIAFETASMQRIGLMPEILPRYRSTYFQHIFSGGYSSGYYSYVWAQVLDADTFAAFQESGDLFNPKIARSFLDNILSRGGTAPGMEMYKRFRGAEPKVDALLKRKGFN